ncbi:MAG: rhodanese-like domain-containing protein [Planctomycetota bacterium]
MIFKQYYLGCLAHASYLIAANGEAAVVDPQRDIDQYLKDLAAQNLKLRYILETHIHADFISGHLELAAKTGAEIVFGSRAQNVQFAFHAAEDGEVLPLGASNGDGANSSDPDVTITVIHTPGHTPESVSYLVSAPGNPDEPQRLLSGDTLFVGEVGRPDLAGSRGFTSEQMAAMLYDSLHDKILTLPGDTLVFPAHGAGSLCGKKIDASKSFTSVAEQRQTNYALQPMTREAFVSMATENLPEVPDYFPRSVDLNRSELPALADVPAPEALDAAAFRAKQQAGARVLDIREPFQYGSGHVPGSLCIPLDGQFAMWAGNFLRPDEQVLLICDSAADAATAKLRLARVGLHNAVGFLDGGIPAWSAAGQPLATLEHVDVDETAAMLNGTHTPGAARPRIIDVRRPGELEVGALPGSINLPLDRLEQDAAGLPRDVPTVVVCRSGYRSTIGCSILESLGFANLTNMVGGYTAWRQMEAETGLQVS